MMMIVFHHSKSAPSLYVPLQAMYQDRNNEVGSETRTSICRAIAGHDAGRKPRCGAVCAAEACCGAHRTEEAWMSVPSEEMDVMLRERRMRVSNNDGGLRRT